MSKNDLHPEQQKWVERARVHGLTPAMKTLVRALEDWFAHHPQGPAMRDLKLISGLGHGTVWTYLPALEATGYVQINRYRSGRIVPGGIILMKGLSDGGES